MQKIRTHDQTADILDIGAIAHATHGDPFSVLGPHRVTFGSHRAVVIRTCRPAAQQVEVIRDDAPPVTMTRRHPAGVFEAMFEGEPDDFDYRLRLTYGDGTTEVVGDPYRYGAVLSDFDLHLLAEGTHHRAYRKLGAHAMTIGPASGFHFAVWAPNAERVSVVGDFNGWDGRVHPMRNLLPSGVWEIFVPGVTAGQRYKFEIRSRHGVVLQKTDPYAARFEEPPASASVTYESSYAWRDAEWMEGRVAQGAWRERPMSIYEVHLGSWMRVPEEGSRWLTYRELAARLIPYVKGMGFTHVELLPIMEHPFAGSWGYQVIGFFAPTSRFGTPDDFRLFVDECHRAGLGVILDWVPGHFPRDAHGLARFDGTALYEHEDRRKGEHQDWGTLIFNYGRDEVRTFLLSSALFWLDDCHVDGLRVDAVASMLYLDYSRKPGEWVPNRYGGHENLEAVEFLRHLNVVTHGEQPGTFTVAEESTSWPEVSRPVHLGGLGFTYKWNMGWMHDVLEYVAKDPIHRQWSHTNLTFPMLYHYSENFILPLSHDEVVHGKGSLVAKMPGDAWQRRANLRLLLGFLFGHPGKKLLFMGGEFGQEREWSHDESLDWHVLERPGHAGLALLVSDLNRLYREEPALYELDFEPAGFRWIDCHDHLASVVSFVRCARDPRDFLVMALNFTPVPRQGYRVGVPAAGHYAERLNSDSDAYGGGNVGNLGGVMAEPVPAHGFAQSLRLTLPPLGFVLLKPERPT